MSFVHAAIIGFLFGVGFGYLVQRGGLCFAHGFAEVLMGRGKRILRLFLIIFVITSLGFLIGGLKPIGHIRGHGFVNILAGMLFGMGILLNGGCILGTLRQMGEGNSTFLVVFLAFIPGMALVTRVIDPALKARYDVQKVLLPDLLGLSHTHVTIVLVTLALVWFVALSRRHS